jgi:hypothetical protein
MRTKLSLASLVSLVLFIGCFETTVSLLEHPDEAKVDRALVGDWTFAAQGETKAQDLILRNLDDKRYYVEWPSEGEKTFRGVGMVSKIKDVSFAEVRPMTEDGSIAEKHVILRISSADNKLGIRHLKGEFFEGKAASNTKELRKLIEENLENEQMYDGEMLYATKKPAAQ